MRERRKPAGSGKTSVAQAAVALLGLLSGLSKPRETDVSKDDRQAETLKDLCASINDAASKASIVWTTFVTLELYLAIAFASITHRDLLFETPVELPLLNVKLPLSGFFLVAPALFVVFHFYLFLTFRLLVSPISAFNKISKALPAEQRETLRLRLDKFFLVQFLAGTAESRKGFIGFSLRAIAWFTTVAAPVIVLLQCQARFLPFHDQSIANLHRVFLFLDLVIILYFWRETRKEDSAITGKRWTKYWTVAGIGTSALFLFCSVFVLTYPGEWLYRFSVVDTFDSLGKENGWLPNRIVMDAEADAPEKAEKSLTVRTLANRDLRFAVIRHSDLRKVNLSGAHLDNATLASVDLRGAEYGCHLRRRDVDPRSMETEDRCASWAHSTCASFVRARIENSQMQGAILNEAQMSLTVLDGTNLQGAFLAGTDLQGASLRGAKMQGAMMPYARLPGANLRQAALEGTLLDGAILWGVELRDADLGGASARRADLQGAHLASTDLSGASFARSAAFKAYAYQYMTSDSRGLMNGAVDDKTDESYIDTGTDPRDRVARTLRQSQVQDECIDIAERLSNGWLAELSQSTNLDDRALQARSNLRSLDDTPKETRPWPDPSRRDVDQNQVADVVADLACKASFAPYAARGVIANGQLSSMQSEKALPLIEKLQKASRAKSDTTSDCDGGRGLDEIDLAMLESIKAIKSKAK